MTAANSWHEQLQQFNSQTKINKIWNTIHAFKNNGNSTQKDIQLQINNATTSDPIKIKNELKRAFCTKKMLTPPPDNFFSDAINYQLIDNKEIHDVNLPFSLSELRLALALSPESSPLLDNLSTLFFKNYHLSRLISCLLSLTIYGSQDHYQMILNIPLWSQ